MAYNFDEIVDRSQNYAAKFEEAELHYGTNRVIPLWIADMDFRTAPCIVEAIKARADQGIFGYTWRTPKYFEAVAHWQERRNGWQPAIEKMAFAPGVVPCMRMILTMFTRPGDKIIIQQPVYHPFADVIENTGRTMVVSPLKRDEAGYYTMDLEDFEAKIDGVKFFILCNPHNPVGRAWTPEELKAVGDICVRHGVEILSDEIHSDLMLNGHKHTCMASVSPEIAALTTTCIAPKRLASLVDIFACAFLALMPHDGGILIVTELAGCTPLDVLPYSFYMFALIIFTCVTIQFGLLRTPEEKAAAEKDPALR